MAFQWPSETRRGRPQSLGRPSYSELLTGVFNSPATPTLEVRTDPGPVNGLSHLFSEVRHRQVTDGVSKTILVGEKHVHWSEYDTGEAAGDNASMYTGYDYDTSRWTDLAHAERQVRPSVAARCPRRAHRSIPYGQTLPPHRADDLRCQISGNKRCFGC